MKSRRRRGLRTSTVVLWMRICGAMMLVFCGVMIAGACLENMLMLVGGFVAGAAWLTMMLTLWIVVDSGRDAAFARELGKFPR